MQIEQFFMKGDMKGAIAYMRKHEEYQSILPSYIAVFEKCQYRTYDVPDILNQILEQYQIYYRDVFYLRMEEKEASNKLLINLRHVLKVIDEDEAYLVEKLQLIFENNGYHALFGKTQGYYGPYIWKETVPTMYRVELPDGTEEYTVNILKGFTFRSWMDYITFGKYGTGGWTAPDGKINCIEQAYDFKSEHFLVSLLKHEAQHARDINSFPGITPAELEYRAKLVELHYSSALELLQKFLSEADEKKESDSHAMASAMIKKNFVHIDQSNLSCIQTYALKLLRVHTDKMEEIYGKNKCNAYISQIENRLFALQDKKYQAFQSKLMPSIDPETIIGVRTPVLRRLAKELAGSEQAESFLNCLPHKYYEENNLHAFLIEKVKDYESALSQTERFLPYIDNWATCDCFCPKVFAENPDVLLVSIQEWLHSDQIYTVRFAIGMLMRYYLDNKFQPEYLALVAEIQSQEYYVNMMRAWYFATALAKQPEATFPLISKKQLDVWTHNKTIQKAVESYRISSEMKQQLRELRIKNTAGRK